MRWRVGIQVDRYISDPTWLDSDNDDEGNAPASDSRPDPAPDLESLRGHPERFADLLPPDTAPEDFVRIVLTPGWWEDYSASTGIIGDARPPEESADDSDIVDERDRMRCMALALEVWSPTEYPLTEDLDELENKTVGPGIILAFN